MAENSKIEWCGPTWPIVTGCEEDGPECANCYAVRGAHRMGSNPNPKLSEVYQGLTARKGSKNKLHWNGQIRLLWDRLDWPAKRFKPGDKVFVTSMGDLHHKDVPNEFLLEVYKVMEANPDKIFQVLTKRPQNLRRWVCEDAPKLHNWQGWPLPNVWVGTSVGRQQSTWRIDELVKTPAVIRFLSCEPLLGPLDLSKWLPNPESWSENIARAWDEDTHTVDWIIAGGESGPNARPVNPDWVRWLRDQCQQAEVDFFFKQWGEWLPCDHDPESLKFGKPVDTLIGETYSYRKVGKKAAGRLLDGREWSEMPEIEVRA